MRNWIELRLNIELNFEIKIQVGLAFVNSGFDMKELRIFRGFFKNLKGLEKGLDEGLFRF